MPWSGVTLCKVDLIAAMFFCPFPRWFFYLLYLLCPMWLSWLGAWVLLFTIMIQTLPRCHIGPFCLYFVSKFRTRLFQLLYDCVYFPKSALTWRTSISFVHEYLGLARVKRAKVASREAAACNLLERSSGNISDIRWLGAYGSLLPVRFASRGFLSALTMICFWLFLD